MGSCRKTEVPKGEGNRDISNPRGLLGLATGSGNQLYLLRACWNREDGEICFGCLLEEILSQVDMPS